MSTIIKCSNKIKNEISLIIVQECIRVQNENLDRIEPWIEINDIGTGLKVYFPDGEIYGDAQFYVEGLVDVFEKLRIKYPKISFEGDACYSDHRLEGMKGVYFRFDRKDKKIHKRLDGKWQKCVICGKYYEKAVIYNSSSMENDGVGTFGCLCSALCMLEYVITNDKHDLEIDTNSLWNDEDLEKYLLVYSGTNIEKKIVWEYLLKYLDGKPNVFTNNVARIWELVYKPDLKPDALFRLNSLIKTLIKHGYKNLDNLHDVTNKYLTGYESNICGKIFILKGLRGDNKKSLSRRIENAGGIILGNKTKAYIYADYLIVPKERIEIEKICLEGIKHKSDINVIYGMGIFLKRFV